MLKKLLIGAGIATIVATSAMAQSYQPEVGSGNIIPNANQQPSSETYGRGIDAYAYQGTTAHHAYRLKHHWDRD